ncbi:MAG: ABC transporter permease [Bacillota bacterium]|nr:ABC transporter permease [Bacillota bacterium]
MLAMVREGFGRDVLVALVVTVLFGVAISGGVARAVDTYLGKQVTGVLGDLGEYDLILHVRQDAREAARSEIAKILASSYKGARFKEGPTVVGRANFFISLPDRLRTRAGLEGLARALGDVPGASGETFIIEPRLSVSGIEPGALFFLMGQAEKLPGVKFCFRDGGSIAVVLDSVAEVRRASYALRDLLDGYRVVEVRFPIGQELQDSVAAGRSFADVLASTAGAGLSRDITRRGAGSDLADLTATLTEMKRFLEHYAARVTISLDSKAPLHPGDLVFLEAPAPASARASVPATAVATAPAAASVAAPAADGKNRGSGARVEAASQGASQKGPGAGSGVLVQVKEISGRKATGIVIEGDTDALGFRAAASRPGPESPRKPGAGASPASVRAGGGPATIADDPGAYCTSPVAAHLADSDGRPQRRIGTAVVTSESKRLAYMVDESVRLLRELETFREDAYQASLSALDILGMYDKTVGRLVDVQRALENASDILGASQDATLGWREAAAVEKALRDAISAVDSLESALGEMGSLESRAKEVLSMLSSTGDAFAADAGTGDGEISPAVRDRVAALRAALDLAGVKAVERARAIDEFVRRTNPAATELAKWRSTLSGLVGRVSGIRALLASGRAGVVVSDMLGATNTVLSQLQDMDVAGMQESVHAVSRDLGAVRSIDTDAIIRELEYIKASLPNLKDDEVGRSIRLIDRYIGGEVIPGDSLQILVDRSVDPETARKAAAERFGPDVRVYVSPVGIVEPGVRSEVYRILREARSTVAALVSMIFTLLVLVLDHAAIVSAIREIRRERAAGAPRSGGRRLLARLFDAGSVYAMVVGAAVLVPVFAAAGAQVPYLGIWHVAAIGAAMGYLVSLQSERISPASGDEITAGIAMGLSYTDVMREIVVPSSRPGILSFLNRRNVTLKGAGR